MRIMPVRVQLYLDDILVQSTSQDRDRADLHTTIHVLQSHGFSINEAKSHFTPTTRILHLGAWIDSRAGQVFLSEERVSSLRQLVTEVVRGHGTTLATLSKLLRKMVSDIAIVPWARLHTRDLQWFLLPFQKKRNSTSLVRVNLPREIRQSLR